jgi:hypothetical protein
MVVLDVVRAPMDLCRTWQEKVVYYQIVPKAEVVSRAWQELSTQE